ncbi:MAG: hypothetical protein Ct9H300mP18_14500 [Candidatus Neomarinimicrobiota bacterium]|nr:MAG: hypothetical protein Ct9H300mP18_14500 [Candidatus Neomarinimicrobiota bacterium]
MIIVLISVVRAITLPGSIAGITYLFTPDWSQLRDPRIWLEALTQNAWDTGAGWGLFLTYAIYIRKRYGLIKNAFTQLLVIIWYLCWLPSWFLVLYFPFWEMKWEWQKGKF